MKGLLRDFIGDYLLATGRPLSLAVVYEDSETHEQAEALHDFLLKVLHDEPPLTATWWRTSILTDPKLAKVATRAVAGSDLIMLSLRADRSPSAAMVGWIESWPLPDERPARLLSLLCGEGSPSSSEWEGYLANLARCRDLVYFPASLKALAQETESVGKGDGGAELAGDSRQPVEPYAHWGLNE